MTPSQIATHTLLWMTVTVWGGQSNRTGAQEVHEAFHQHIATLTSIDEATRDEAQNLVMSLAADSRFKSMAIVEGLLVLYPEFSKAMDLVGSETPAQAIPALQALEKQKDPFLASAATFLHGRSLIMDERFEAALPVLDSVLDDFSEYSDQIADTLYFKGMCEAATLKNQEAKRSFTQFLENYPFAPERMRVGAWQKLQQLNAFEEGSITDIQQRMDFSRRKLQLEDTGEGTQSQQDKIVALLGDLIKKVEEQESQGSNTNQSSESQSQGEGQQQPSDKPGESQTGGGSKNPNGIAKRSFDNGPASEWSRLRDRSRDPAFSAIKEKYPARYQKLIEQYYKSFQNGDDK
jgi:tetratricopeptide (TPR) repeat protein